MGATATYRVLVRRVGSDGKLKEDGTAAPNKWLPLTDWTEYPASTADVQVKVTKKKFTSGEYNLKVSITCYHPQRGPMLVDSYNDCRVINP